MSSTESRQSWHPAFMPNSAFDLAASSRYQTSPLNVTPSKAIPTHIEPPKAIAESVSTNPRESGQGHIFENHVQDEMTRRATAANNDHPELDNLQSALTTSLASPGGVEMNENPVHGGTKIGEDLDTEIEDSGSSMKAQFPLERPAHESSDENSAFAREVPRDVTWGEDDDVDPEWNLYGTETDPFKLMATSDRTNSFPQVPPLHNAGKTPFDHELPKHQAGEILGIVDETLHTLFTEGDTNGDFFGQIAGTEGTQNGSACKTTGDLPYGPEDSMLNDKYPKTYGGDIMDEPDDVFRYEEGLPLVGGNEIAESSAQGNRHISPELFADDGPGEEDNFFGNLANGGSDAQPPPALGRKSTMQVMNAMEFQPLEDSRANALDTEGVGSSESSHNKATRGGLAVSRSSIPSQVLGGPETELLSEKEDHPVASREPSAEDLAAKWKAALADDEFLDEDELLDESAIPEDSAVNPACFFGSDDEGFLDDDEPSSNTVSHQQMSPPVPMPVTGSNGTAVGFDSLTAGARTQQSGSSNRYLPPNAAQTPSQHASHAYAPAAPRLVDLSAEADRSHLSYGAGFSPAVTSPPLTSYGAPPQQKTDIPKSQSFADKSKGGYSSPYDLPMEVVKPRKRASMQQMSRGYSNAPPPSTALPPRSSSMYTQGPPPSRGSASSLSPPVSSPTLSHPPIKLPQLPPSASQTTALSLKKKESFFEELPLTSRPKPAGRYTPQPSLPVSEHNAYTERGQRHDSVSPPTYLPSQGSTSQSSLAAQGLIAPPKVSPYAPLQTSYSQPPVLTSRYSPGPSRSTSGSAPPPAVSQSRYASAPPSQYQQVSSYSGPPAPAPPAPILAHQPRTSSPLIHFERPDDQRSFSNPDAITRDVEPLRRGSSGFDHVSRAPSLPMTQEIEEQGANNYKKYGPSANVDIQPQPGHANQPPLSLAQPGLQSMPNSSQPSQNYPPYGSLSPSRRVASNYVTDHRPSHHNLEQVVIPPQRSQTQSPSKVISGTHTGISAGELYQQPLSVHNLTTSRQINEPYSAITAEAPKTRTREFSQALNYIAPTDGREHDPLQRWRGGPVFAWGVGGTFITSFPKEVPRYGIGQAIPMIICSPGEVKVHSLKDIYPLEERLASFPGPLKGKPKKKDIIAWLTSGIDMLEQGNKDLKSLMTLTHEDKRKEERMLLWKILRVMIENDGILEGNAAVNKAVRGVISPGLDSEENSAVPQYATGADLSGIFRTAGSKTLPEAVDPAAVDELRKNLLRGEREKAVWEAVDKRLWAHAMLISNTLSRDLYKQVAQEFIQKEVKSIGENTESLAALYEIFAGNFDESVDELVPPSARAGLQMISTSGSSGPSKGALDGLDRWRETLGLVLSNRSPEDSQAINSLGRLLSGYGRAEAAHICFLFARSYSVFGGVDDPMSNIVLVGSDHLRQPYEFDMELEPILLSEVYEYGLSLSTTSNVTFAAPHLAVYKLQHATILAQSGQREKALQYCEAIASSITSQVRRSPYHHAFLLASLDDLSKRLKQSPKDESSSWISKPIDMVSGSVWAKFNKFVAGDENDAASGGAGSDAGSEVGPFARIAGDTPTISRSPSNKDLYGSLNGPSLNGGITHLPPIKAASRYAPGQSYTPPSAHDPSLLASYGSPPQGSLGQRYSPEEALNQEGQAVGRATYLAGPNNDKPRTHPETAAVPYNLYAHTDLPYAGPSHTPFHPVAPVIDQHTLSSTQDSPTSVQTSEGNRSSAGYGTTDIGHDSAPSAAYMPSVTSGYEPASGGIYAPPSSAGYEPPLSEGYKPQSYEPADGPDSPIDTKPKKESFMDDDDQPLTTIPQKSKAEMDKEAEEMFRKAAEADAKKDTPSASAKKGWGLGGWFAKKEATSDTPQPNKPIKAKLGEESSFVYDPELKRWINKKAGKDGAQEGSSATPPPPRAGPPRTVSGSPVLEPTSAPRPISGSTPPQRAVSAYATSTPPEQPDGASGLSVPTSMSRTASNGSMNGPPSGPPTRPATSMSNASSIDDLLGPPTARKGGAKKAKKGRGYIDVMGEKSST